MEQSLQIKLVLASIGSIYVLISLIFAFTNHVDPYNTII